MSKPSISNYPVKTPVPCLNLFLQILSKYKKTQASNILVGQQTPLGMSFHKVKIEREEGEKIIYWMPLPVHSGWGRGSKTWGCKKKPYLMHNSVKIYVLSRNYLYLFFCGFLLWDNICFILWNKCAATFWAIITFYVGIYWLPTTGISLYIVAPHLWLVVCWQVLI